MAIISQDANMRHIALTVQGQVQGVGFRPFVWRLAHEQKLAGSVANTSAGVRIELQGQETSIESFCSRLRTELPPLAKITAITREDLPIASIRTDFIIQASQGHAGQNVLVSPDVAICPDCLADIRDPANPRFAYPFTNCTSCGPRFSITRSIPYDRPATTMACFALCQLCAAEYGDPANRRFHAQPIACPQCGPKIWFVENSREQNTEPTPENCQNALQKAGNAILSGKILALRGLGGFQLVCDARNPAAIDTLRQRKRRPHKALAVMARDIDDARQFCEINESAQKLLTSPASPIVLCPMLSGCPLPHGIAPDCARLGLMLPYTPLHALLLDYLASAQSQQFSQSATPPLLIMTSANPQAEPICLGNREAIDRLGSLADAFLCHDRDILCRVDDSVVLPNQERPIFIRRARGYVPEPVALGEPGPCILGAGGELKAAFCLTRGGNAFLGQHIGDLKSPACLDFYEEALAHLQKLLEVVPQAIIHDLHPDFLSTRFAHDLADRLQIPAIGLQHHAAHAAACLGENGIAGQALALCLDGSGLGSDGSIWGGELLLMNLAEATWKRVGSLAPFPLPGGETAILEPWRIALGLRWQTDNLPKELPKAGQAVLQLLEKGLNCPQTSSCGRLFDATASLLGLCDSISYEGQAAIRLEQAATQWLAEHEYDGLLAKHDFVMPAAQSALQIPCLDTGGFFHHTLLALRQNTAIGAIAAGFHHILARNLASLAAMTAEKYKIKQIALTGGVLQNSLMARLLPHYLRKCNLAPVLHKAVPPGDGGLAFGQAVWGHALARAGRLTNV